MRLLPARSRLVIWTEYGSYKGGQAPGLVPVGMCETFGMVFIAEAFGGWLIGQVADAGRERLGRWLLGGEQERALQQAATAAIHATAWRLRPKAATADDVQGADHLARVIDQVFQQPPPVESLTEHPTLLQGLQAGVAARLAVLDDARITGTGQSSAELLAVAVPALAEALTSHLVREIVTRGAGGGPLTPLAEQLNHDLTHLQGQQHSASLARLIEDLQTVLATLHRLDRQDRSLPASTAQPLGRPIQELTDPFALEVHRAIDTPGGTAQLPALPAYIERDHDRQLRAIVEQAAEGHSGAAVLVGGSSTGKTRACWEAIQGLPHHWRLWHPIDPSRPEAAAIALPRAGPRTVIWLNEAQHYLLTPAGDLGERVAAGLRELLRDPDRAPVLLLGTIWPQYWAILTTSPSAGQLDDPHAQARALLSGVDILVPDAFTGAALRAVQAGAKVDPRLAEAAAHAEDGRITQFLAGAPALLERYRNAPPAAKAVLEAAIDARRLGHGLYLPHGLLEVAAPGYLSDQQWDALTEDWLEQAMAYCASPCRGAPGPLTETRPRPGQLALAQPRYRLADYLEQTGRATRGTVLAPAALWDAFVEHANHRDLLRIAEEAEGRSLYRHAVRLYRSAAEAGDPDPLGRAAGLLERIGRIDEAIDWYRVAAEAGDPDASRQVADLLEGSGRIVEAISVDQRASGAGDPDALQQAAGLLEAAGRLEETVSWYQRAAEAGDTYALGRAAGLLEDAGRPEEAIDWLQTRATESGDTLALRRAAGLLERAGHIDKAVGLYRRAAEAGDSLALQRTAELLEVASRIDEAVGLYRRAAEAGYSHALHWAAELLERAGHIDEAIDVYRGAANAGDPYALGREAELLDRAGRTDAAIGLYQRAAEASDAHALGWATELLEEAGRLDEAIDWLQTRATEAGDPDALGLAAGLLGRAGRLDEAIEWYQRAADAGDPDALRRAVGLLEGAGRLDDAIALYRRAAEGGDPDALRRAAGLLAGAGRLDEAIDWFQRAADAGDPDALRRAAEFLEVTGRLEEAIGCYQRAAEAGYPDALERAADLLEEAGRLDEAAQLRHYGLEPGSRIAQEWH